MDEYQDTAGMESTFFERLVNKVSENWQRNEQAAQASLPQKQPFLPFITIARDPGSGGRPIGEEVAKRLGFRFYDQDLLEEIAKSGKLRKDVLADIDERGRTVVQDFIHELLNPDYVSDVTFIRYLTKVVATIAYRGNAVILGRGAALLTPKEAGLHVRVTAPLQIRIERAQQFENLSLMHAKARVSRYERERREFVKQYFGHDIQDPELYDMTLNTQHFSLESSVTMITNAFFLKFPKVRRSVRRLVPLP